VHPIREIVSATERVGRGDLEFTVNVRRKDEFGDVARAFNATVATLRRSQARVEVAQRLARFSDWDLDVDAGLVEGSPEFARIFSLGEAAGAVPLQRMLDRIHGEDRESLRSLLLSCATDGRPFRVDVRTCGEPADAQILHMQGQRVVEEGRSGVQASVQDVTQRKRFEEQIRLLAYDDSLTGIGNRRFFAQQLDRQLEETVDVDSKLALLFIDLDRFKLINDTMGHSAGDELLQTTSSRIVATLGGQEFRDLRTSANGNVTIARLGGDEFTVLLPGADDDEVVGRFAERLLTALAQPSSIQGQTVVVTGSIGISMCPRDGTQAEDLVRSSDTAMYHAKGDGRNRYRFYHASMQEAAMERWRIENRLRRAIEREELGVHFQPRTRVDTGRIAQVEALVRWRDPELGAVSPDDFIAIAEESGLICALGSWVLQQSVQQVKRWRDDGWEIGVSINLSSHQLQPGLLLEVADQFQRAEVDPGWIEFEVTESALLVDEVVAVDVLERLQKLGSRISLDDFGTGYSSLSHLARLPVNALKIDRSFIEPIAEDADAAGLVAAIVATAKVLRLDVVAEGVETEAQRELLEEMGCDEMQGFLFGHAVNAESLEAVLKESQARLGDRRKKPRNERAPTRRRRKRA
jgi:diguanylate cyclase (GGDEF)-like protein